MKIVKPIVAGVSWGGYVTMSYATQYPDQPVSLIFCDTEAKVSVDARKAAFEKLGGKEVGEIAYKYDTNPGLSANFDDFIKYCVPLFSRNEFKLVEPKRLNMEIRTKFIEEENSSFDYRKQLTAIRCPVLLLAGENDPVHPSQCAEETAKCLPVNFRNLHIIKDAGAPVYCDKPAETLEIITNFINSILSFEEKIISDLMFHNKIM